MRNVAHVGLSVVLLAALAGCRTTPGTACRLHDFADTATATVGSGLGFKLRAGPLHLGLLQSRDWAGLRGGEWFRNAGGMSRSKDDEFIAWGSEEFLGGYFRGKHHDFVALDIPIMGHGGPYDTSGIVPFISLPKKVPWTYYTQVELVAGLGGTVRLGVNPGEMLDWFLGWFGADICRDDYLSISEYVRCRLITADGVTNNAAKIRGRNIHEWFRDYDPASPMGIAVSRDRVDIARALVDIGGPPVIFPTAGPDMVQAMINLGADVNASVPATTGRYEKATPLINVAWIGCAATAEVLLKNGARVDTADREGRTALYYAVTRGYVSLGKETCDPGIVKALIEHGATIKGPVPKWHHDQTTTLLGCAIFAGGNAEVVRLLLAAGANPNQDGLSVTLRAQQYYGGMRDYAPVVQSLVDAGAQVTSNHLFSALNPNVRNIEIVRCLLQAGADPNAPATETFWNGMQNKSPLVAVFQFSYSEESLLFSARPSSSNIRRTLDPIVGLLLDHGADPRHPEVMPLARRFLRGTATLKRMERMVRKEK